MRGAVAVFKRELKSYFGTPLAYVFLVIFLGLAVYLTFFPGLLGIASAQEGLLRGKEASLRVFFAHLPLLFVFFAPALAMRMWAEERRTGTIEHLFSLPLTVPQAVLGKFLAGWLFLLIALALTAPLVITVAVLGEPDAGPLVTGYLGAGLLAGAYLAIGCFFSALTKNQVISFVLGALGCLLFVLAGLPAAENLLQAVLPAPLLKIPAALSFLAHYDGMLRGLLELRSVYFFLAVTVGFLTAGGVVLDARKAS